MKAKFDGFSKEALKFFAGLEKNNNKEWFEARKDVYLEQIKAPMENFVAAVSARMARFAPDYVTEPKRAIYRIYRDTRFSTNKTPYKTNAGALFFRGELGKNEAGAFYVEISHKHVGVAGGLYMLEPETLRLVRSHLLENWDELTVLLKNRALKTAAGELQGERLSRPPKGYPADHAAIELIKAKQWYFWRELPAELALSAKLVDEVAGRFEKMTPVVEFLNRPLAAMKKKQKPMTSGWL